MYFYYHHYHIICAIVKIRRNPFSLFIFIHVPLLRLALGLRFLTLSMKQPEFLTTLRWQVLQASLEPYKINKYMFSNHLTLSFTMVYSLFT